MPSNACARRCSAAGLLARKAAWPSPACDASVSFSVVCASYPGFNWRKQAAYALERVLTHGIRRAAEMREVANTVSEAGLAPGMSSATVAWQQRLGNLHLNARDIGVDDYRKLADAVLAALAASST